ncbi:MAG: spoVID-dependent spore coat assembly factor [Bacillales bacterium]|nr:spoVID-dependent spore coat assembly factor [Bacillales bacterium]
MKIHIVQKGDTLYKIAKQYGVDFQELKNANAQLSNPEMIYPGMKIKVPSQGVAVKTETFNGKESPTQMLQSLITGAPKESPVLPAQEFAAPFKGKEVPIAPLQQVQPVPQVKEQPMPTPVPTPVKEQPIDINNFYTFNVAMEPPKPVKEKPVAPIVKEKPMDKPLLFSPVAKEELKPPPVVEKPVEQPIVAQQLVDDCVPIQEPYCYPPNYVSPEQCVPYQQANWCPPYGGQLPMAPPGQWAGPVGQMFPPQQQYPFMPNPASQVQGVTDTLPTGMPPQEETQPPVGFQAGQLPPQYMQGMQPNMMPPQYMQGMPPMMPPQYMQGMPPNMMPTQQMQGVPPNMMPPQGFDTSVQAPPQSQGGPQGMQPYMQAPPQMNGMGPGMQMPPYPMPGTNVQNLNVPWQMPGNQPVVPGKDDCGCGEIQGVAVPPGMPNPAFRPDFPYNPQFPADPNDFQPPNGDR